MTISVGLNMIASDPGCYSGSGISSPGYGTRDSVLVLCRAPLLFRRMSGLSQTPQGVRPGPQAKSALPKKPTRPMPTPLTHASRAKLALASSTWQSTASFAAVMWSSSVQGCRCPWDTADRAIVLQKKTGRPARFELMSKPRQAGDEALGPLHTHRQADRDWRRDGLSYRLFAPLRHARLS